MATKKKSIIEQASERTSIPDNMLNQVAVIAAQEEARGRAQGDIEAKRARLDCVRIASDIVRENRRDKPQGERDIEASDITTFADILASYVNGES